MITITVDGAKSSLKSEHLEGAALLFLSLLNVKKKTIPLEINISLCKLDALGYCDFNRDFTDPEINILLNKNQPDDQLIITLAHELVHAKQFLRKELRSIGNNTYWKGSISTNMEWEDEAYLKEVELYNIYNSRKNNDKEKDGISFKE